MPKPPFRKGIDPLFDSGLLDRLSDPLARFFWDAEKLYLENVALREALKKAGGNPSRVRSASPGSPGHHRTIFDEKYRKIAQHVQRKMAAYAAKHSPSKYGPN
jgi:hypothetical protein